jgi:hypothetical protein
MGFLSVVRHHVICSFVMPRASTRIITISSDWFQMNTNIVPMRSVVETFMIVCHGRHQCILQLLVVNWSFFLFSNFVDVRQSVFEICLRDRHTWVYMID